MKIFFKSPILLVLLLGLNSCSATQFGDNTGYSDDPRYGFSPQVPLVLNAKFKKEAEKKTSEFISKLRTGSGEKLRVVSSSRVANPRYRKPRVVLYNWITAEPINQGNGRFLREYLLESENGQEKLRIYVNHFEKEVTRIPETLILAEEMSLVEDFAAKEIKE